MASIIGVDTIQNSTSGTTGMAINTTGRVTTPNKIAFHAIGNVPDTAGAYVTASPIKPGTVKYNFGSGYDNSNGRFTVPSGGAGLYWFHLHMGIVRITAGGGSAYPRMFFYNAAGTQLFAPYTYLQLPASTGYGNCSITITFDLAVGDYVYLTFSGSNADYYADQSELGFQGMLIG